MRSEKKAMATELKTKISESVFVILADYKGLDVAKTQELRRRLGGAKAQIQVVKNRVFKNVASDIGYKGLDTDISGPSAMVYGKGDVVQVAKVLKTFIKETQMPVIKIGAMQGVILSADDVNQLANLPAREVLLGQLVGTIAAPMSQLVGVLNQKAASLLYALNAVADKKSKAEGSK